MYMAKKCNSHINMDQSRYREVLTRNVQNNVNIFAIKNNTYKYIS